VSKERKKTRGGLLLLDAGDLFFGRSKGSCDQKALGKADLILESYQAMRYDAINLSQTDLLLGVPHLQEKGKDLSLPFVSSNLVEKGDGKPLFDPFIVKKTNGLTVGIFGLMDQHPNDSQKSGGYLIRDPYEAAREVLGSLREKAGLIIALSTLSREKNIKLLEKFSDIDFIIVADKKSRRPTKVNQGYILSTGDKGKHMGLLNLVLTSLKRPLALKDIGIEKRLKLDLSRTEERMALLDQKKGEILQSRNERVKERFENELKLLKQREAQCRKELTALDHGGNHFENRRIPLATRPSEKTAKLSKKRKEKAEKPNRSATPGPHIKITPIRDDKSQRLTYVIRIEKTPNPVRSLGLDVHYDANLLKYSGHRRGDMVRNFDMFDVNRLKSGILRVGGFEAGKDFIDFGKGGVLVRLDFQVIGKGNLDLKLGAFKDDISSWKVAGQKQP